MINHKKCIKKHGKEVLYYLAYAPLILIPTSLLTACFIIAGLKTSLIGTALFFFLLGCLNLFYKGMQFTSRDKSC